MQTMLYDSLGTLYFNDAKDLCEIPTDHPQKGRQTQVG